MKATRNPSTSREQACALVPLIIADIYQLAGQLRRNAEAIARPHGQSQARWHVLSAASAEPKTVPQIARRLGLGRQNVQRVADLLIGEALAAFKPNPDHRTSPYLVLTDAGHTVLKRLMEGAHAYHQELADEHSQAELVLLHRALRRFCEVLDEREAHLEPEA